MAGITDFIAGLRNSFEALESGLSRMAERIEGNIRKKAFMVKRILFRSIFEIYLLAAGITMIIAGVLLYLAKFFPAEVVLIIAGLVLVNIVLLTARLR